MSLIITTSKQQENPKQINSEKPEHYTNHFRSPIEIDTDSEIALESIKINRSGNVAVPPNMYFNHFFGEDPQDRITAGRGGLQFQQQFPTKVEVPEGSYSIEEFRRQMDLAWKAQYNNPLIWNGNKFTIQTNASGLEQGIDMEFTQKGDDGAGGWSNIDSKGSVSDQAYYPIKRPGGAGPSDAFDYVLSGSFTRTGDDGDPDKKSKDDKSIGILTDKPFGLVDGELDILTKNASAGSPYICIGLTRPNTQFKIQANPSPTATAFVKGLDPYKYKRSNNFFVHTGALGVDATRTILPLSPKQHMDYGVLITDDVDDADGRVYIFHSLTRQVGGRTTFSHYEIKYWDSGGEHTGGRMTRKEYNAAYEGVRFTAVSGTIQVEFKQIGKNVYDEICGPNTSTTKNQGLKPFNDNTYALYPCLSCGKGTLKVEKYETNFAATDYSYVYPSYDDTTRTYTPGSDQYSNNRVAQFYQLDNGKYEKGVLNYNAPEGRSKRMRGIISALDKNLTSTRSANTLVPTELPFTDKNASGGIGYDHVLYMGRMNGDNPLNIMAQEQNRPNLGLTLGFPDRSILQQNSGEGYVEGDTKNTVSFRSISELDKHAIASFVRLPTLQLQSFNGAQQGISKILYQIPQFSPDGRQTGPLYFTPPEKTYVSLRNMSKEILNYLTVQIVDADEKEVRSLSGSTQAVFHIRKRR